MDIFGNSEVVTKFHEVDEASNIVIKGGRKEGVSHDEPASDNGLSGE